ncbi:MAG: 50S ribosomal protein L1 [Acidimicrobiia bacterium]|nr:50S ribosomal protein L1 [Acidimicrobiia bacterium]
MAQKGKRYSDSVQRYDKQQQHSAKNGVELIKSLASAKFDETLELAARLGVDPRQSDQVLRGTVSLPSGTGTEVRVAVFAQGEAAQQASEAGADVVGADDLAQQIEAGNTDFDVVIATPDMMGMVGKLGRVLGPRGLMPNPKTGTVTSDVAKAVSEFKSGRVEYRTDRQGNVHVPVGKLSFEADALVSNITAVVDELSRVRPAAVKGRYFRKLTISATMGPGVKLDLADLGVNR